MVDWLYFEPDRDGDVREGYTVIKVVHPWDDCGAVDWWYHDHGMMDWTQRWQAWGEDQHEDD